MEITNMILEKIGEDFAFLSSDAKEYLKNNLEEDDIVEFERLLQYYQLINDDDLDAHLIRNLLFSVRLLRTHLE
jgi:hypothetical protein